MFEPALRSLRFGGDKWLSHIAERARKIHKIPFCA
jgi:hypothetical protein